MYFRTVDEIIDAAIPKALETIRNMPKKVPKKYEYKENLKSRKGKK
ncbi:MAG: hypothetical protein LIR50_05865 [Bacillota bacterium]|nr:hypothetical protein [Bacillota bacterium]